jgi:tRNA (guanine-N7-)-methyltransferase
MKKRSGAPITQEGERPQKKFYRQRAHCNPLSHNDSLDYPIRPSEMDWTKEHYPSLKENTSGSGSTAIVPTVLDVGCGFGGLSMALANLLPDHVILGLEIRVKVTEYVRLRIKHARQQEDTHHNCSVLRTNSMKVLTNYFAQSSIDKLFFCFPDPQFKKKNHPRRIITDRLLSQYAFVLKPEVGRLYCITDVKELHDWHVKHCDAHPLFQRLVVDNEGLGAENDLSKEDPCINVMRTATEESQKVERNKGQKYYAVYKRIRYEDAVPVTAENFFKVPAEAERSNESHDEQKKGEATAS